MIALVEILVLAASVLIAPGRADALRSTAPKDLTRESAAAHLAAASIAGFVTDTDPALLLAIAHHESRYAFRVVARERGKKVSCGVMTPVPTYDREACADATSSMLAGYLAGARHLKTWSDACHGDRRCTLIGYAGGYALIRACARGENLRGCRVPGVFGARAAAIERALLPRAGT
jgi:hypothetical protein